VLVRVLVTVELVVVTVVLVRVLVTVELVVVTVVLARVLVPEISLAKVVQSTAAFHK